jgi:outer membrane protein OmpA-like peptidoglycan-associated protein
MAPPPQPEAAAPPPPRQFEVFFDFDRYDLTAEGTRVVDAAVAEAQQGGPAQIEITGNTDLAGTSAYNMVLSKRRAETVRRYMIARGIDAGEITVRWVGKSNPAVATADGVRDPRNRRVEIMITPEGSEAPATVSMAGPSYDENGSRPEGAPTDLMRQD